MPIPDYQTIMLPLLRLARDGKEHTLREATDILAREYASQIESKIILIDGEQLAQFMVDHNIGLAQVASYDVKRVDSDYFIEE